MEKIKLGNLCKPSAGQIKVDNDTLIDYIDISSVDNETKKVTGYQTITFGKSPSRARKAVKKGDILVSTVRPNLNAVAILEEETPNLTVASTGFCVLECIDGVDPRYIFNFCKSKAFIDDMVSQATGASYPAVSDKIVRSAYVPKYSYHEQKHISFVLDRLTSIIKCRNTQLHELDNLIKARFVEVISQSNSIDIKLKDVVETDRIITYGIVKPGKDVEGGVIIIKVKDFPNGIIQTNDFLHSDPELESKYARSRVKAGDLLYSIRGTVGRTAFVTPELEGANITQDTARLSIDTKRFNPNYIRFALGYDEVVRAVESQIKGVAMKGISLSELREIEIPCVDYDAQQVFGEFVKQVDKSKSAIQKSLEETQLLFDSLMQQYFG